MNRLLSQPVYQLLLIKLFSKSGNHLVNYLVSKPFNKLLICAFNPLVIKSVSQLLI
jgi:hypothetical protein